MMLTIREVAQRTGHSPHKIRRLIKGIADQPTHPDRAAIEPSVVDVERLTKEGVQFTWRITEELVRRELGETADTVGGEKNADAGGEGESLELLSVLQRAIDAKEKAAERLFEQLRVKDEQMAKKDEQIAQLNDRLRESNILMQSLQKQLPEPGKAPLATVEAGATALGTKREGKKTTPPVKPKKRHWLGKMFALRA